MAQNVIINGVTYPSVPEVDIPKQGGGTAKFMDTDDANVVAGAMRSGYSGYAGGQKVSGSIQDQAAATFKPSSSDQTLSSGKYLAGAITFSAVLCTNLLAQYIAKDVVVKVGCADDDDSVTSVTGTLSSAVISQDGTSKILSIS